MGSVADSSFSAVDLALAEVAVVGGPMHLFGLFGQAIAD